MNNKMKEKALDRIDRVNDALNAGFKSKSAKNNSLADLRRAYEFLTSVSHKGGMMSDLLDMFPNRFADEYENKEFQELYYGIPLFHLWKDKHSDIYNAYFPNRVAMIEMLVNMRQLVKDAPVIKVEKSETKERIEKIQKSLREELEFRKTQYQEGMNLAEIVGPNVTANVHLVHGHRGTVFVRAFYYLNGEFMPLNMIICILDDLKKRG
jgi:hypothetical protein